MAGIAHVEMAEGVGDFVRGVHGNEVASTDFLAADVHRDIDLFGLQLTESAFEGGSFLGAGGIGQYGLVCG